MQFRSGHQKRSRRRGLQFRQRRHDFGQTVKRNPCVQVVDVVIADVAREPVHHRTSIEIAGGVQSGKHVVPLRTLTQVDLREIVLHIKQIRPQSCRNQHRQEQSKQQRPGGIHRQHSHQLAMQ